MASPVSLDALKTLDAIVRRGSFAAAAEELHRVPSAVSYNMAKLERDLGFPIFDRSGHRAELTPAGLMLLDQGRDILRASETLVRDATRIANGWETELRIAIDSLFPSSILHPLLKRFYAECPGTNVRILEEVLGGTVDAVVAGRADLGIGCAALPPSTDFYRQDFRVVEWVFAVAKKHPLLGEESPIAATTIAQYPAIVVADTSQQRAPLNQGLFSNAVQLIVPTLRDKIDAQIAGLGIGYLPKHLIEQELESGKLNVISTEVTAPSSETWNVWHSGNTGLGLQWFTERLAEITLVARI